MTKQDEGVLSPEGAREILENAGEKLGEDEKALLFALIGVEEGNLDADDQAAMEKLKERLEGYDVDELLQAVRHMKTATPNRESKLEWPDIDLESHKK